MSNTNNTPGAQGGTGAEQQNLQSVKDQKTIADNVLSRVIEFQNAGEIKLPSNYSVENACKSAFLMLTQLVDRDKKPALSVCTKESVANALLDMCIQGLSPAKKQCYFIVYGNTLVFQRSYMGAYAIAKRVAGVETVVANAIYLNDIFEYEINAETGIKRVLKHEQKIEDIDPQNIRGAYAVITNSDGTKETEIMNIKQIRASWNMGSSKGESPAHKNFGDEMAKKTVISRSLKLKINSSDDAALYHDNNDDNNEELINAKVKNEIENKSSIEVLGFKSESDLKENINIPSRDNDGVNNNSNQEELGFTSPNQSTESNNTTKAPFS